jgi:drug/metabolite transporter (DMT)-like permease
VNQLCYLSPFLSLFFVSTVLGEQIVPTTYIGLVLIVAGIVFNEYLVKPKQA